MNLVYKKILGQFTKVLAIEKTLPPIWEKFPNNPVIFFWRRTLCCTLTTIQIKLKMNLSNPGNLVWTNFKILGKTYLANYFDPSLKIMPWRHSLLFLGMCWMQGIVINLRSIWLHILAVFWEYLTPYLPHIWGIFGSIFSTYCWEYLAHYSWAHILAIFYSILDTFMVTFGPIVDILREYLAHDSFQIFW